MELVSCPLCLAIHKPHVGSRKIFGCEGVIDYVPQVAENMSVAASFKRCRIEDPSDTCE